MVSSAATSVVLRPTRSPKWPKSAEPIGRAKNAIANVASEASVAEAGSDAGKNKLREDQHRRRRVDVEVEELDRRADQAGKQHLAGPVDGHAGTGGVLAHRNADVGRLATGRTA